MADDTSRKSKDSANVEADKNYAHAYHNRRKDEPAAAPLETDAPLLPCRISFCLG